MSSVPSRHYTIPPLPVLTSSPSSLPFAETLPLLAAQYRAFRLLSLQVAPQASASTYEKELQFPRDVWIQRLSNPDVKHFVAKVAPRMTEGNQDSGTRYVTSSLSQVHDDAGIDEIEKGEEEREEHDTSNSAWEQEVKDGGQEWVGLIVVHEKHGGPEEVNAKKSPWQDNWSRKAEQKNEHNSEQKIAYDTLQEDKENRPVSNNSNRKLPSLQAEAANSKNLTAQTFYQLNALFVHPSQRRTGLGRALIETALEDIRQSLQAKANVLQLQPKSDDSTIILGGLEAKVVILVDTWNEAARGLYVACGFVDADESEYLVEGETRTAIRMERVVSVSNIV